MLVILGDSCAIIFLMSLHSAHWILAHTENGISITFIIVRFTFTFILAILNQPSKWEGRGEGVTALWHTLEIAEGSGVAILHTGYTLCLYATQWSTFVDL